MDKALKEGIKDINKQLYAKGFMARHYGSVAKEDSDISFATSSLTALIIKWLEGKETGKCDNPRISPKEYVSHEMALDACEPELEGQIYKEETAERCGECLSCIKDQLITELIGEVR